MNLSTRLPLILGLTALAAVAALARSRPSAAPAAALTLSQSTDEAAPRAALREQRRPALVVYVAGEVPHPGVFQLPAGARVEAALRAAGGASARADLIAVNLAEPLRDGEEIVVPPRGADGSASVERAEEDVPSRVPHRRAHRRGTHRHRRGHRAEASKAPEGIVNLNVDNAERLSELPGIGPELAERIVAFRQLNGPFASVDDLGDVAGVSAREIARLTPFVTVR